MKHTSEVQELPIKKIQTGENNSRADFNEDLSGLMQSIKELGQLQPIGVRPFEKGYKVVYGYRRFHALLKLNQPNVLCVVHTDLSDEDADAMNLAENVQRRNISLAEVGRYVELLEKMGLGRREAAVKLGVGANYIKDALTAYQRVPDKYRSDIEIRTKYSTSSGPTSAPGKISMRQALAIENVRGKFGLNKEQIEELFKHAKAKGPEFQVESVYKYATNVKNGHDAFADVKPIKRLGSPGQISMDEYDRLYKKYVAEGPARSVQDAVRMILRGAIADKVELS